jgi:hypothetical protein
MGREKRKELQIPQTFPAICTISELTDENIREAK